MPGARRHDIAYFHTSSYAHLAESVLASEQESLLAGLRRMVAESVLASDGAALHASVFRAVSEAALASETAYAASYFVREPVTISQAAPSRRHDVSYFDSPPVSFEPQDEGMSAAESEHIASAIAIAIDEGLLADAAVAYVHVLIAEPVTISQAAPSRRHDVSYFDSPPVSFEPQDEGMSAAESEHIASAIAELVTEDIISSESAVPFLFTFIFRSVPEDVLLADAASFFFSILTIDEDEAVLAGDLSDTLDVLNRPLAEDADIGDALLYNDILFHDIAESAAAADAVTISIDRLLIQLSEAALAEDSSRVNFPLIWLAIGEAVGASDGSDADNDPFILADAVSRVRLNRRRTDLFSEGGT